MGSVLGDLIAITYIILTASNNGWRWRMFVQSVRRLLWKFMKMMMKVKMKMN